jgi:aprataxin and PNK-like factor
LRWFDSDIAQTLPVCPFGATCYRKNLLHFSEYTHPFDLLNPDVDSSDEEENKTNEKKRKAESEKEEEEDDGNKTEEYDSDDVRSS